MSVPAALFIDRDGTLVEEPPDERLDTLEKVRFLPGAFAALTELTRRGYRLGVVANPEGLGTKWVPRPAFWAGQQVFPVAFRSPARACRASVFSSARHTYPAPS